MQQFQFQDISVSVTPTQDTKQWYMTVEQVSEAYGRDYKTILRHIANHHLEIREGIEKGVVDFATPGGVQKHIVLYREGVIKLGFFIRSHRAAAFRQFATDLVVQHMQHTGQDSPHGFETLMRSLESLHFKIDHLAGVADTVFGDEKDEITRLVQAVADKHKVDGRTVWGWVQTNCDVGSYKKQNLKIKNYLKNLLGEGLRIVKE